MAKQLAVELKCEPTAFTRFVLHWWLLGLMLCPFFRFMPIAWLFSIEVEVVDNG